MIKENDLARSSELLEQFYRLGIILPFDLLVVAERRVFRRRVIPLKPRGIKGELVLLASDILHKDRMVDHGVIRFPLARYTVCIDF